MRPNATRAFRWLLIAPAILLFAGVPRSQPLAPPSHPPTGPRHDRFAVATQHPLATDAALRVLRAGGTAADAAVTAALALGVVQPDCSGMGGGGFAIVWDAKTHRTLALDFREKAPQHVNAGAIEAAAGDTPEMTRGALAGVPGEVAGLYELHARFGRRPWRDDVAPAIDLADSSIAADDELARNAYAYRDEASWSPELRASFEGVRSILVGETFGQKALAATLRRVADEGPKALYSGPIAQQIVDSVGRLGGRISLADLASYRVVERTPLRIEWEGMDVYTMPPPSAGGLLLAETLRMNSREDLKSLGLDTAPYVHLLAETFRGAMADRVRTVGDPTFVPFDPEALGIARLHARRAQIQPDRTLPLPGASIEEHGTSHIVVVDADGSVVSLTTTIGDAFGSRIVAGASGVLLNDELIDFTTHDAFVPFVRDQAPGWRSAHAPNAPRPGARPVSSMTPTIVEQNGVPVLALGGAGGLRIPTAVTQAFLAHTVFGRTPEQAVALLRMHTPFEGATLELERGGDPALATELRRRGERIGIFPDFSAVQMVAIEHGADGSVRYDAAADPRFGGRASVE